jgi:hypothetical protein
MGKTCLEKWLRQNKSSGTCPTCRAILFKAKATKKPRFIRRPETADPPALLPTFERFNSFYSNGSELERSIQTGFLNALWTRISALDINSDETVLPPVLRACISTPYDELHFYGPDDPGSEHKFLAPYIPRSNSPTTTLLCPLMQLAILLCKVSTICGKNYLPTRTV